MNTKIAIKNYLSDKISLLLSVITFTVLTVVFKVACPILMKLIIDSTLKTAVFADNSTNIIIYTILLGVSTVASIICDATRQSKNIKFGNDITANLRSISFDLMMKSELYEINKIENDELCNTIVDSTHIIGDEHFGSKITKLGYYCLLLIALLITTFVFNQTVGMVTLLSFPIFYLINKYLNKAKNKRISVFLKSKENHEYIIKDHFNQLKTIKTRNGINKETDYYEKILKENKRNYAKEVYTSNLKNNILPTIFISLSWFIIFLVSCVQMYNYSFSGDSYQLFLTEIGSILGCVAISPKLFSTFKSLLDTYYIQLNIESEYEKLDKILSMKVESRSETIPSLEEVQSLKFNSVSFDYKSYGIDEKIILDKIDFEIKKGEKLGIIGLPGAGKTTIADLITKVIRPRQGNVLINNCDINKLNTYYLRDIVTYVPQNYELLDLSIEENIIYPLTLDEYKYNDALNKCKLKDLIFSLPNHDETKAREANLQASDVQKIALANAFYKDSPIMILDDSTSKLDSITEDNIMNEFYKLKNKISIVISNRITSVSKCDKILIINNGKVSEYGRVDELLANKHSSFAKMFSDTKPDKKVV